MTVRTDLDVLLADPDGGRRTELASTLRRVGWRVRESDGAEAALAACREAPPAVVVLDVDAGAPGDDLTMIDAIKGDPDLFGIGVVLRGRRLELDDGLEALGHGANGILVDPIADAELVACVRSAAQVGLLQDELRGRAAALERMAFSDGLTAVPNRRFLDRQLAALMSAARRHRRPLALALFDIDRFKAINDEYGHAVGDTVLVEIARRLGGRLRTEDHVGRYGGEEFLALLPDTDARAVSAIAEDLRKATCARPFDTEAGPLNVTVSVGWATWDHDEPAHRLVARADRAMYRAKAEGRNLVRGEAEVPSTAS